MHQQESRSVVADLLDTLNPFASYRAWKLTERREREDKDKDDRDSTTKVRRQLESVVGPDYKLMGVGSLPWSSSQRAHQKYSGNPFLVIRDASGVHRTYALHNEWQGCGQAQVWHGLDELQSVLELAGPLGLSIRGIGVLTRGKLTGPMSLFTQCDLEITLDLPAGGAKTFTVYASQVPDLRPLQEINQL